MNKKKMNGLLISLSALLLPLNVIALEKNETVYTDLNYDGSIKTSTVTNHLSFVGDKDFDDESELLDILNLNGDEKFVTNGNKITWSPLGKDIFYSGKTEKVLPIKTTITYYLDGKESNLEDIIGKKGLVEIVYNFANQNKNYTSINGRMEAIYTPFLTSVATMLSEDAKNVTVSTGRVIATGTKTAVIGIASPGLFESTKIESLKKTDEIKISFETEKFSLGTTYIVSTPKFLEDIDLGMFDKAAGLTADLDTLESSMELLEKGARELSLGTSSLADGSAALKTNLAKVVSSVEALENGSTTLDNGLKQLSDGLKTASNALDSDRLNLLATNIGATKLKNDNEIQKLLLSTNKTFEELALSYATNSLETYTGNDASLLLEKNSYETILLLTENSTVLDKTVETFGVLKTTIENMQTVVTSVEALSTGASTLNGGMTQLATGIDAIYKGSIELEQGATKLKSGADTLSAGATKFKVEGIDKLTTSLGSVKTYADRIKALANLSQKYEGFTSSNSNSTTFVSMIKPYKA